MLSDMRGFDDKTRLKLYEANGQLIFFHHHVPNAMLDPEQVTDRKWDVKVCA